ncbi:MAG: hypothetical protein M3067_05740 [Chloroflexota bacterium]|nr:hypothetical protein [Chloroflexota bacterium]
MPALTTARRRHGSIDEAEVEHDQTIHEWQHLGNRGAIASQLEAFAFVALARRNGVRAARLLGAAEALRELAESPILAFERPEYEVQVGHLREELDEGAFTWAWAEGREMNADDAVAFALSG